MHRQDGRQEIDRRTLLAKGAAFVALLVTGYARWAPPLLGARRFVARGAPGRARSARLLFLYWQTSTPVGAGNSRVSPGLDGHTAPFLGFDVAHRLGQLPAMTADVLEDA